MRSSVVLRLALGFAMFGFGLSLQCYTCPEGPSTNCAVQQDCGPGEDSCLKLTSGDQTYTRCVRYADCDFKILSLLFPAVPSFKFSCCQSNLCNSAKKSLSERFKEWLG